jgi:hypothetical protein
MNIPFLGKGEYTVHDLVTLIQPDAVLAGIDPASFSVVGGIIGKMLSTGAYKMHCEVVRGGSQVFKAWTLRRQAEDILKLMPECRSWSSHASGMAAMDKVGWVRDERMFNLAVDAALALGKKPYEVVHNGRSNTVIEPVFLMEYLAKWQIENLSKLPSGSEVKFWHSADRRGGRFYAYNRDGLVLPTMYDGDVCALYQLAEGNPVTKEDIELWSALVEKEYGVTREEMFRVATDREFALGLFVNPIGKLKSVGSKKRNVLRFIQNCYHISDALASGVSHGHIGYDAHAQGPVATSLAIGGSRTCHDVMMGRKVYEGITECLGIVPSEVESFVRSREWAKNVLTVTNYTGRVLGQVFLYGMGGELEDEDGSVLAPFNLANAVIKVDKLRSGLELIKDWPQSKIKELAASVSAMSVNAALRYDSKLFKFGDLWLAHQKAKEEVFSYTYGGITFPHYKIAPALQWFPTDEATKMRDLPQISVSLPHSVLDLCKKNGWPTRFQPRMAPFTKGFTDDNGPVVPWSNSGEPNRVDTPNGSLVAVTTCQDGNVLTNTINEMAGTVVTTRHDAITVRIGAALRTVQEVYTRHMYRECVGNYRHVLQAELGKLFPNITEDVSEEQFVSAAKNIFR